MRITTIFSLPILFFISLIACDGCKKTTNVQENNITFDSIQHAEIYHLFNDTTKPHCNLQIKFVYPADCADKKTLKSLQSIFVSAYFGSSFAGNTPEEALKAYRDQYIGQYVESYKEYEDESRTSDYDADEDESHGTFNFYEMSRDSILFNKNNILSFSVYFEDYAGGAHGSHRLNGYVVDLGSGKLISESDIFCEECPDKIADMIVKKIIKQNNLSRPEELENVGYSDIDKMVPNGNFLADDKGITYIFNEYEIAPYFMGVTEVFLPYNEIEIFMNKKSPLAKFLH